MTNHSDRLASLGTDNRVRCLAEIRSNGEMTLAELAKAVGLSKPTVKSHLQSMVESGVLRASELNSTARGGRPAPAFSVDANGLMCAVFDVSRHEHRYLLCDLTGVVRAASVEGVPAAQGAFERTKRVADGLQRLCAEAGVGSDRLGLVSGSVGALVGSAGAIIADGGIEGLLAPDFREMIPGKVILENDLKSASYAEQRIGCAQGLSSVVYALAWHQVAAGIVLEGRLHRGVHELAGELNRVAGDELLARTDEEWADWPTFLEVLNKADQGDVSALESVDRFIRKAALQLAMLALTLDPEMIVLGGPLVHRSEFFVDRLTARLGDMLEATPTIQCTLTSLRSWGPALGALLRGLDELERSLVGAPTHIYDLTNATAVELPLPAGPTDADTRRH